MSGHISHSDFVSRMILVCVKEVTFGIQHNLPKMHIKWAPAYLIDPWFWFPLQAHLQHFVVDMRARTSLWPLQHHQTICTSWTLDPGNHSKTHLKISSCENNVEEGIAALSALCHTNAPTVLRFCWCRHSPGRWRASVHWDRWKKKGERYLLLSQAIQDHHVEPVTLLPSY